MTRAKVVIAHESNVQVAIEAAGTVGIPKSNIFVFGEQVVRGILPYTQVLLSNRRAIIEELSSEDANNRVAYLCFSSGTTGKKKIDSFLKAGFQKRNSFPPLFRTKQRCNDNVSNLINAFFLLLLFH